MVTRILRVVVLMLSLANHDVEHPHEEHHETRTHNRTYII